MKKRTLLIVASLFIGIGAYAQGGSSFYRSPYKSRNIGSYDKSTALLTFSYGFPNVPARNFLFVGGSRSGFGPVYVKFEKAIMDEVGIGIQGAMSAGKYTWGTLEEKMGAIHFGVLGYYHFNKLIPVKSLDVYAGVGLAFINVARKYNDPLYTNTTDSDVYAAGKIGARYYFGENFAVYAEGGYDLMSEINLGISLRF